MEVIDKISYNHFEEEKQKTQIVLTHTSRNLLDYMVSIKYRFGGRPLRLPHYLISRDGKIIQVMDNMKNGNYTNNQRVN